MKAASKLQNEPVSVGGRTLCGGGKKANIAKGYERKEVGESYDRLSPEGTWHIEEE